MITIIFAPPRTGKTCFLTHIARENAFNRQRNRLMQNEIQNKQAGGFSELKTIPIHCVSANYDMQLRKFGYTPRFNRRINPYRLGFKNNFVDTHFTLPYECVCITEAQKYLNSRMSLYFPDWQSRWYEQHGHNDLDIWLDTQRPMLIDVNIRELSQFIEIVKLDLSYNDFGKVKALKWLIRKIDNSGLFDKYMASGKSDKSCYVESTVVLNVNDDTVDIVCLAEFDCPIELIVTARSGYNEISSLFRWDYVKQLPDDLPNAPLATEKVLFGENQIVDYPFTDIQQGVGTVAGAFRIAEVELIFSKEFIYALTTSSYWYELRDRLSVPQDGYTSIDLPTDINKYGVSEDPYYKFLDEYAFKLSVSNVFDSFMPSDYADEIIQDADLYILAINAIIDAASKVSEIISYKMHFEYHENYNYIFFYSHYIDSGVYYGLDTSALEAELSGSQTN